jgi:DNA invertase Pin-like site-specific DNA recombinase
MRESENNEIKNAVIYCRVSTKEQAEEGNSLNTQEKICREYAVKNGFTVSEVFVEQGESAKTSDRTELKKLFTYCSQKKNGIKAVIAYKIDRISRNTDDYSQIRILLKNYGVEIKSTSEYFENTPAGRFMENIIANVAQFDNDVRTERSVGGMRDATREGRYVWMAPVGYRNAKIGGKATIEPDEKAILVKEAFEAVAEKMEPIELIRQRLVKRGLTTRSGKPVNISYFYVMLRNPLYKGLIVKFGEENQGLFKPLVSEELFDKVGRVMKNPNAKRALYVSDHPDFPLRRFVKDEETGFGFTAGWSRGHMGKRYPFYRAKKNFSKNFLETRFQDFLNTFALTDRCLKKLRKVIDDNFGNETRDQRKEGQLIRNKIDELEKRQNMLFDDRANGYITGEVLKRQLEIIGTQIDQLRDDLCQVTEDDVDISSIIEPIFQFLKNPYALWDNLDIEDKRTLQWFEFPQGVTFDGMKYRTAQTHSIFKLKSDFLTSKFYRVHSSVEKSNFLLQDKAKIETKLALIETHNVLKTFNKVA